MMDADVVVVGAGPCGSYLAGRLAEKGLKVLLLDKREVPGKKACAGVIGEEAFREFPLPRRAIRFSVRSITLISPSGVRLSYRLEEPFAHVVDRASLNRFFLGWAIEKGAVFKGLTAAFSIEPGESGAKVCWKSSIKKASRGVFSSRIVVVASGCSSLPRSVGLGSYPGIVAGAQRVDLMRDVDEVEVYVGSRFSPGGFAWLVPEGEGRVRVGLVASKRVRSLLDAFSSFPEVSGRFLGSVVPPRISCIPAGPIPRTYGDSILAVGDAAGQVKPLTYGGIFYGLICADCAFEVILKAFDKGRFDGKFLSLYQKMWKKRLWREMELGSKLRDKALRLEDEDIDSLFYDFSEKNVISKLKALIKFDWHGDIVRFLLKNGRFLRKDKL